MRKPSRRNSNITAAVSTKNPTGRGFGAAAVYDTLRREILNLKIAPGTVLDETELAVRFRLSRSPVREALIRLSADGLVTTLRNRSSVVASFDIAVVPNYLDALELMYRVTCRLAAQNRTDAQLQNIRRIQMQHQAAAGRDDSLAMIALNHAFHSAIAEATGNSFYIGWTRSLLDQGQRILGLYIRAIGNHVASEVLTDHVKIVEAIEMQNADAAEEAGRRDAEIVGATLRDRLMMHATSGINIARSAKRQKR